MSESRTIEDLTPDQQEHLQALLKTLESFPMPERFVRCAAAMGNSTSEDDRQRIDSALDAAWAFDRLILFLNRLRDLNAERKALAESVRGLSRFPNPTSEGEAAQDAHAPVHGPHSTAQQEIVLYFMAVSIQHIHSLLKTIAVELDCRIDTDDEAYLKKFRHLRNRCEHSYGRIPVDAGEIGQGTRPFPDTERRQRGGLERDDQDRIVVINPMKPLTRAHVVEANDAGLARVECIVQVACESFMTLTVERVRDHFLRDPGAIPLPESISDAMLLRVG